MKNLFAKYGVPALIFAAFLSAVTAAQDMFNYFPTYIASAVTVNVGVGADDSNVPILIRSTQSTGCFDVGTTTARQISFYTDASGVHTALDTTINASAACGATAGKLDLTDADCSSIGEVVSQINKSAKWRAVVVDAVEADTTDSGSAAYLLTKTYTDAQVAAGVAINWDTNVKLQTIRALTPFRDIRNYLGSNNTFIKNPYGGYRAALIKANQQSAFTTQPYFEVYSVLPNFTAAGVYTDTTSQLWREVTGSTGAYKAFDFSPYGIWGKMDEKLLIRVTGASVFATELAHGFGYFMEYPRK